MSAFTPPSTLPTPTQCTVRPHLEILVRALKERLQLGRILLGLVLTELGTRIAANAAEASK